MTELSLNQSRLGRYEIQERIGRGGMAQVYRAHDTNLDRTVAVKVLYEHLSDDATFKERFEREAKFVAGFNHPNIVQIYDFDSVDRNGQQLYYMVMPYIPGSTLRDELEDLDRREQRMAYERVIQIIRNVADALDYAHKRGMVHRDVKPGNILFDERGQAILMDFGIARLVASSNLTQEGLTVGTPAYMSPEQATGDQVDARSDIYALAVIAYELIAGRPPFHDDGSISVLLKHLNAPVPPLSDRIHMANPALDAMLYRALAKDPNDRYPTAGAFAHDLAAVLNGEKVDTTLPPSIRTTETRAFPVSEGAASDANRSQIRRTLTVQMVTQQVETIARSPLGILVIGLLLIAGLVGINLLNRTTPAAPGVEIIDDDTSGDADSMTGGDPDADSMTGNEADVFFVSTFAADDPTRDLWTQNNADMVIQEISPAGEYLFTNQRMDRAVTSIVGNDYDYRTVSISMQAALQPGSAPASGYGIVFRYLDEDNYNVFAVDGEGRFSIWVRQDARWTELRRLGDGVRWSPNEAVRSIGETNKLTIDVFEDRLVGYVNDRQVVDVQDSTFEAGRIGIYLANPGAADSAPTVAITRYTVTRIAESMTRNASEVEGGAP